MTFSITWYYMESSMVFDELTFLPLPEGFSFGWHAVCVAFCSTVLSVPAGLLAVAMLALPGNTKTVYCLT